MPAPVMPSALIGIAVTLALSFLIGLEREEHRGRTTTYGFGGVRTFPVIGLSGYMLAALSQGQPMVVAVGFAVLGSLLWLSYRKKLAQSSTVGVTSEVSGLFTYLLGALVFQGNYWQATTLAVVLLLLLELKHGLENLAHNIPSREIYTFTRFLLLSAVILPVVPNQAYTSFHLNPFHTWLVIVAISGLSYVSYLLSRKLGPGRGVFVAAVLGGLYSSTATTVSLAKRSRPGADGRVYPGAILAASGLMYIRLTVLLCIFSWPLGSWLAPRFLALGLLATLVGWLWSRTAPHSARKTHGAKIVPADRNPLEIQAALVFAVAFLAMRVATLYVQKVLGSGGIYGLSVLTGVTDVDPFVMSLTQTAGVSLSVATAAHAVAVAAVSNNLVKAAYAAAFGSGEVRRQSALMLVGLGIAGLVAL